MRPPPAHHSPLLNETKGDGWVSSRDEWRGSTQIATKSSLTECKHIEAGSIIHRMSIKTCNGLWLATDESRSLNPKRPLNWTDQTQTQPNSSSFSPVAPCLVLSLHPLPSSLRVSLARTSGDRLPAPMDLHRGTSSMVASTARHGVKDDCVSRRRMEGRISGAIGGKALDFVGGAREDSSVAEG